MSRQWEVNYFNIRGNDFVLFGNGRMQVAVNILIKAIHPTTLQPVTLTTAELSTIELCDYYNTSEKLTGGWTYTAQENEFAHTMPSRSDDPEHQDPPAQAEAQATDVNPLEDGQAKRYWVSTTKYESKDIGARIKQPNNIVITTRTGNFDTRVTLRGTVPVTYTTDNTTFKRYDTANGSYWDQDNYYLTSNSHPFKKVDRYGHKTSSDLVQGIRQACGHYTSGGRKYIRYIWDMGPRTKVKVGYTHWTDGRVYTNGKTADITIREEANTMCLTRLTLDKESANLYPNGFIWNPTWFRIYDIYGNSGDFSVVHSSNRNTMSLKNGGAQRSPGSCEVNTEPEETTDPSHEETDVAAPS